MTRYRSTPFITDVYTFGLALTGASAVACVGSPGLPGGGSMGETEGEDESGDFEPGEGTDGSTGGSTAPGVDSVDGSTGQEPDPGPMGGDECTPDGELGVVETCAQVPSETGNFEVTTKWTFAPPHGHSWTTPLVANLSDDNGDGVIGLCDVPDIVVTTSQGGQGNAELHVLDGVTGNERFRIDLSEELALYATPALGDIDGDGVPEIVTGWLHSHGHFGLKAFEHDGTLKWSRMATEQGPGAGGPIGLYDLDADGDAEIVFNYQVFDHEGNQLWAAATPKSGYGHKPVAADLDGDGDLELIMGSTALHHDGSLHFDFDALVGERTTPQVANFDDDPEPEILLLSTSSAWMLEHDGSPKWGPLVLEMEGNGSGWASATVNDFDGDGQMEWAKKTLRGVIVMEGDQPEMLWQTEQFVTYAANSGISSFDLDGDGRAEVLVADAEEFHIRDGVTGESLTSLPRTSFGATDYPVVADIDNDGVAEILLASSQFGPALTALENPGANWVGTRRIWNQYAYSVTNVDELGRVPSEPVDSWNATNTVLANGQLEDGVLCRPDAD